MGLAFVDEDRWHRAREWGTRACSRTGAGRFLDSCFTPPVNASYRRRSRRWSNPALAPANERDTSDVRPEKKRAPTLCEAPYMQWPALLARALSHFHVLSILLALRLLSPSHFDFDLARLRFLAFGKGHSEDAIFVAGFDVFRID